MSIAMAIWICAKAGTVKGVFSQPGTLYGSNRGWVWVSTFCSLTNSWMTACLNMSDFARYSRAKYGQLLHNVAIDSTRTDHERLFLGRVRGIKFRP